MDWENIARKIEYKGRVESVKYKIQLDNLTFFSQKSCILLIIITNVFKDKFHIFYGRIGTFSTSSGPGTIQ